MARWLDCSLDFIGEYNQYFAAAGVLAASYVALNIVSTLLKAIRVWGFGNFLAADLKSKGAWAVVTGSTDGIGKAYAQELARKGLNIVLVSRSPGKLADVALEIEAKFKVKTKSIPVDFSGSPEIYKLLKAQLVGLEIGVLVNNVGYAYDYPEYFTEIKDGDEFCHTLMNVNITSTVMMTRLVLPQMAERRKGVIINLSSGAALSPMPLLSLYSAAKIFVDYFSQALQLEYRSKGLIIQSVLPFFVATKMSKIRKTSLFVPSPTDYVRGALATVGLQDKTHGYWSHALEAFVISFIPKFVNDYTSVKIMNTGRKAALKKKAQKAKSN